MGQISYRFSEVLEYLYTEIRKAHEIIAGVFSLTIQYILWNFRDFRKTSISKNAVLCLLWIYRILIKIFCLPFPPFFIWFPIQATKIRKYLAKSQKTQISFRVSREFTRIFSFFAYKIRCLLSIVRCQVKKIRVDTWDSWSLFCELCVFARVPSVQIREIRGAVMKS